MGRKKKKIGGGLKELSLEMLLATLHPFYCGHKSQWVICCPHQGSYSPCTFLN